MNHITLTMQDCRGNSRLLQLEGKEASLVMMQIRSYGIDQLYDGQRIAGMGIYIYEVGEE